MRKLGIIKETDPKETRVALVPEVVLGLIKDKLVEVIIEKGAGLRSGFLDKDYEDVGATVVSRIDVLTEADYIIGINGQDVLIESGLSNKVIIGLFDPYFNKELIKKASALNVTLISLELIPRISRAQSMDVLSSQANIAGYMAVILAASKLPKVMPLMMTAAGTIKPAKILVVGAGVAGLQAIATAKRLGAIVFAYDVRPVVKEQVESLGAKFVDIKLSESGEGGGGYAKALSESSQSEQREKLAQFAKDMDAVITTAQIPGRKAPLLLDERVFFVMKSGSIIIDMAAASGGNVTGTVAHEWVRKEQVLLYGADNLARMVPKDASFTFGKNIRSLLDLILTNDGLNVDDEIMRDALICHRGAFINKSVSDFMEKINEDQIK